VLALLQRIRDWLKQNKHASQQAVIEYLNPILRGFGNYYRYGSSKRVFGYIDHKIWRMLWKWSLRRHPNKGKRWVMRKYFRTHYGRRWTFAVDITDRRGKNNTLCLIQVKGIPIERHVKIKGTSSPDDSTLSKYWKDRQTAYGKTYWTKGSKYYEVAENQQWICPVCGEHLFNGEELQTHHKIKVNDGGTDKVDNLVHLHKTCHKQVHGKRTEKQEA
jgi:RNA-directed DNA polymerase